MTRPSDLTTEELINELTRRNALPPCPCGKWRTYVGRWDSDANTLRCHGCLKAIAKCTCR